MLEVPADVTPDGASYACHARPGLAARLAAIRLDKTYVWAQGDRMVYVENGCRREVIDCVGGFGSTLHGHNHPELLVHAQHLFAARVPIHAQASLRSAAGELAHALSKRLSKDSNQRFIVTFASTGAEAMEAAIKHAALEYNHRVDAWQRRVRQEPKPFVATVPEAIRGQLAAYLAYPVPEEPEALLRALEAHNAAMIAAPGRYITLFNGFHGKTRGALALSANAHYREPFGPDALPTSRVHAADPEALRQIVSKLTLPLLRLRTSGAGEVELIIDRWCQVEALVLEPVQGEGGVHQIDRAFAECARYLADQHGFPLIIDEIQCGVGRTGCFTAAEHLGISGDYYTFGKSLGGGIAKISALAIQAGRYLPAFGNLHTSTFAEDDWSCRMALKALEVLDREKLVSRCAELGHVLKTRLESLKQRFGDVIAAVRGVGLMVGIEFASLDDSPSALLRSVSQGDMLASLVAGYLLNEEGIRVAPTLSARHTLRVQPSANFSVRDIDCLLFALERVCLMLRHANAGRLVRFLGEEARSETHAPIADYVSAHAPRGPEPGKGEVRVAFLGHLIEARHARLWDPSLAELSDAGIERMFGRIHRHMAPCVTHTARVTGADGETVHLSFYGAFMVSAQIEAAIRQQDLGWLQVQIEETVKDAHESGCVAIGLGGYTSIVTNNCKTVVSHGLTVTSGNALTVGMGIEGLKEACRQLGITLDRARLGIIGAGGNIASTYARLLARHVSALVLVGRRESRSKLDQVAMMLLKDAVDDLRHGQLTGLAGQLQRAGGIAGIDGGELSAADCAHLIATFESTGVLQLRDQLDALKDCDLIVAASNSAAPLIFPKHLKNGPVAICDISVPPDAALEIAEERGDVLVFQGGVVRLPHNPELCIPGIPLPAGAIFACMAETTLLGLAQNELQPSVGAITPGKVTQALAIARRHGYALGELKTMRSF